MKAKVKYLSYVLLFTLSLCVSSCDGAGKNSIVGKWETEEIELDLEALLGDYLEDLSSLPIDLVVKFTCYVEFSNDDTAKFSIEFDPLTEYLITEYFDTEFSFEDIEGEYTYDYDTKELMINGEILSSSCYVDGDEMSMWINFLDDVYPIYLSFTRVEE